MLEIIAKKFGVDAVEKLVYQLKIVVMTFAMSRHGHISPVDENLALTEPNSFLIDFTERSSYFRRLLRILQTFPFIERDFHSTTCN